VLFHVKRDVVNPSIRQLALACEYHCQSIRCFYRHCVFHVKRGLGYIDPVWLTSWERDVVLSFSGILVRRVSRETHRSDRLDFDVHES
jgi:hypothetical protein